MAIVLLVVPKWWTQLCTRLRAQEYLGWYYCLYGPLSVEKFKGVRTRIRVLLIKCLAGTYLNLPNLFVMTLLRAHYPPVLLLPILPPKAATVVGPFPPTVLQQGASPLGAHFTRLKYLLTYYFPIPLLQWMVHLLSIVVYPVTNLLSILPWGGIKLNPGLVRGLRQGLLVAKHRHRLTLQGRKVLHKLSIKLCRV